MILDVDTLRQAVARGERFSYRPFWGHRPSRDGRLSDACFSQWWPCSFVLEGQIYSSAEQYMMAAKAALSGDDETRAKILATHDPAHVKQFGRAVRGYDEARWAAARFATVVTGNVAKFGQDARLRAYLDGTGEEILVEASPLDAIWGIGHAAGDPAVTDPLLWKGLNLLGFALVRAREILRRV